MPPLAHIIVVAIIVCCRHIDAIMPLPAADHAMARALTPLARGATLAERRYATRALRVPPDAAYASA